jgi:hypothetical protein
MEESDLNERVKERYIYLLINVLKSYYKLVALNIGLQALLNKEEHDRQKLSSTNLSFNNFFNTFSTALSKWSCLIYNIEDYVLKEKQLVTKYITQFKDLDSLMKSQHFNMAIQVFTDEEVNINNESIHDEKLKELFVSMHFEFLHFNYKNVFEELKNYKLSENNEILEKLTIINNLSKFYSPVSYESARMFILKTDVLPFILQVLQNDNLHKIVKHIGDENISRSYLKVIESNFYVIQNIMCFYNQFRLILSPINSKILFELSKTLNFFFGIESYNLLKLIPFALNYDDDNEEETNIQLRNILKADTSNRLHEFLQNINSTKHDIKNSRKALNCFTINKAKSLYLDDQDYKEFIRFSIHFIKHSHLVLLEDSKKFNTKSDEYQSYSKIKL